MISNPLGGRNGTLADLNGDGDEDLVMAVQGWERVSWQPGMGDGTFGEVRIIAKEMVWMWDVRAADMDGDGDMDLVYNRGLTSLVLLRNGGYGNFGEPELLATGLADARWFTVGDLDSDGDTDVITGAENTIHVLPNNGDGTMGPAVVHPSSFIVNDLDLAYIDGDAFLDVVVLSDADDRIVYRPNDGSGGLLPSVVIHSTTSQLQYLFVGDGDGDGDTDIFAHSGFAFNIFRNNGVGVFTAAETVYSDNWVHGLTCMDLDLDGNMDLVIGTSTLGVHWRRGLGNGNWAIPVPIGMVYACTTLLPMGLQSDGTMALVALSGSVEAGAFTIHQAGVGQPIVRPTVPMYRAMNLSLAFTDLDQDGDLDLLCNTTDTAGLAWYENLGYLTFATAKTLLGATYQGFSALAEDLDLDGDMDLVVVKLVSGSYELMWYANNGAMEFSPAQSLVTAAPSLPLRVLDIDDDGDPDILINIGGQGINVYTNDGTGTFTFTSIATTAYRMQELAVVDVDGDNVKDLVGYSSQNTFHRISLHRGTGDGQFGVEETLNSATGTVKAFTVHDLDQDGDLDLCFESANENHVVWMANNGDGTFGDMQWIHVDALSAHAMVIMDHDQDGINDVLLAANGTSSITDMHLHRGLGAGQYAPADTLPQVRSYLDILEHVDLDNDGDRELVSGSSSAWLAVRENVGNSPYTVNGAVFHDVNADGVPDLDEPGLPFIQLTCTPLYASPTTNASGGYTYYLDQGAYILSTTLTDDLWLRTTDSSAYHVQLSDSAPILDGRDFGFAPAIDTTILIGAITSNPARCFGSGIITQWITLTNLGTTQPSGWLAYELGPGISFVSSVPMPDSLVGSTVYWSYDTLDYYQFQKVETRVAIPTAVGTPVSSELNTWLMDLDGLITLASTETWADVVVCGYDPNDKQVLPAGIGELGVIDLATSYLQYTIRFQNTGTDTAFTVVIRDQLAGDLDANSVQLLGTSHTLTGMEMAPQGQLAFHFENIMLPDSNVNEAASHGFVKFRVRRVADIANGTTVLNNAAIFFDINEPVITNSTISTFVDCAGIITASITPLGGNVLMASSAESYQWLFNGDTLDGATGQTHLALANGEYAVRVTGPFGCIATSTPIYIGTVGLGQIAATVIGVLQNGDAKEVTFVFPHALSRNDHIEIFSVDGRTVTSSHGHSGNTFMFNYDALAPGLYLMRVGGGQEWVGAKFIVP